ncbi:MAG: ParB N-terminal domain-containing protein [Lachnospiraceae bacterium]|nr:ParB N-terminal domain-containing protein [Clostridia bacterium]MBR1691166.1 ParB N-terminal domain-containing protein [Lachnospiraceae bacterium]
MIDFVERVPIDDVTGSEYNPRVITDDALEKLKHSIKRFGMVKPLIVNDTNNVIVAGHQRKKAATAIGLTHLPCVRITSPSLQDEILFNLMHNSIETSGTTVRVEEFEVGAYHYCPVDKVKIESEPQNVLICSEITKLMSRYGEWGSVVTDGDGNIILNAEYAYCARKMGYGVLVYAIPNEEVKEFLEAMGVEYGKYNFDNLGVKTYHQFLAQPKRLSTDGRQANSSILYEKYLIPRIQKGDSCIDIGAGRMAYVKLLKSKGYNMHAYEPSLMVKGANKLDMKGIIANILNAEKEVRAHGLFDWCVLEAVINSVVDDDFEKAVLTTCNAVLKSTGTLITCTRNIAYVEKAYDKTKLSAGAGDCLWYLDDKNYTLGVTNGIVFKQKFHTRESYVELLENYFEDVLVLSCTAGYVYCACSKPKQLPQEVYETYLEKELNIEYPNGFKHNKHKGLMDVLIEKVAERYSSEQ